jgi:hypothetical protein
MKYLLLFFSILSFYFYFTDVEIKNIETKIFIITFSIFLIYYVFFRKIKPLG